MKVLHALETFLPTSENWIHPQITRVPGVRPAVLCSREENRALFPIDGAPVLLDPPPWSEKCGLARLANSVAFRLGQPQLVAGAAARKWRPALIHAHFGMRGWASLPLQRALGVPMITSFYGIDAWMLPASGEVWPERLRELFSRGDFFLAEGPAMRRRLVAIGCPEEKVEVIRLGVDLAALPFLPRDFSAPLRVVMMGRFVEKKGLPDGLRAFAQAVRGGADLQMTIIGDATDAAGDRIKNELHEIASAPDLTARIHFTGFLPPAEARVHLRGAHLFLCPSKHAANGDAEGGSPLALTEAMATGMLCLGTAHCDIPELISDGETGFLRESGDVVGLASALDLAASAALDRPAICRAGRERIEREFGQERQCAALRETYDRVVQNFSEPQV